MVAWPLVTLAVLQIAFGSYPVYPFIHWTMFAFKEPDELSTAISRDVVLAVDEQGETRNLNFNHLFGAVRGAEAPPKPLKRAICAGFGPGMPMPLWNWQPWRMIDSLSTASYASWLKIGAGRSMRPSWPGRHR